MQNKNKSKVPLILAIIAGFVFVFLIGVFLLSQLCPCSKKKAGNIVPATSNNQNADSYFGNEFIQIKSPRRNTTIKSPVLISGKANVFEGNVRARIKDDAGNVLTDTFITASGAYDKLYPFEKEINYTVPASQNGTIEIFEESTKDGSDIHKVEILVVFEDYADISDWKIYGNIKYGFSFKYPQDWKIKEGTGQMMSENYIDFIEILPNKERVVTEDFNGVKLVSPGIYIYKSERDWKSEMDDFNFRLTGEIEDIKINGVDGIKKEGEITENLSPYGSRKIQVVLKRNNEPYVISAFDYDKEVFDQILSTFKFIQK